MPLRRSLSAMPEVAWITSCAECHRHWLPDDEERWRAFHGCDEDLGEPAETFLYCSECAEREFGCN
jgi:hypothetical protein